MKTTRVQDVGNNVVITLRVMSLRRKTHKCCQERSMSLAGKFVTREREGYVGRFGMTLMEVLMSCAIMSIGVVMVATIFPLSTLRVLEANRQTNSTIAKFSAEALFDVDPNFVQNPDGVTGPQSPAWSVPAYFVDPLGYQTFHRDESLAPPINAGALREDVNGNDVLDSGEDKNGNGRLDPTLRDAWGKLPPGSPVNLPLPRRYTGATLFPNVPGTVRPYPTTNAESDAAIARALQLVGQPDNWKLVAEGLVDASLSATTNITSLTLENDVDLSSVPTSIPTIFAPVIYRAVIFDRLGDQGGLHSEIRYLTASSGNVLPPTVSWVTPLPARFENGNIGKVRIEQLDEAYTWVLTARRASRFEVLLDVVVFFRRSFSPEHEYIYPASFRRYDLGAANSSGLAAPGAPDFDDNGNGVIDDVGEVGFPRKLTLPLAQQSDDEATTIVRVDFATLPSGLERPAFRKGGFVCDTKNGLWYRIQGMQNESETTVELILDRFVQSDGTEDLIYPTPLPYPYTPFMDASEDTNVNGVLDQGGIYWNPSVVNVFSVGKRTLQ